MNIGVECLLNFHRTPKNPEIKNKGKQNMNIPAACLLEIHRTPKKISYEE